MSGKYNVGSIQKMDAITHVRERMSMYIGDASDATKLLIEVLDNSLDEVIAGYADTVGVLIDTKANTFVVMDSGRGIPFDQKLPLEEDPPVMICNSMYTSGKFEKKSEKSAYKVASGLHGIGMTAVYALSENMTIDIFTKGTHAIYKFQHDGTIERSQEKHNGKAPYSTRVAVKPHKKYFEDLSVNVDVIEERLRIACANFPQMKAGLVVDGVRKIIKGVESDLINDYLSKSVEKWYEFETNSEHDSCVIRVGWDDESTPTGTKVFSTVNLVKTTSGSHINKVQNILKSTLSEFGKKNKYEFLPEDVLSWCRIYINLKIVEAHFEAQVKDRLARKSDISVMDELEKKIETFFKKNQSELTELLEKFQNYRKAIQRKEIEVKGNSKKRGSTKLTKLRDCINPHGELIIGEGASAVNGLIKVRDPKKHAILPLKGVIPNSLKKKDLLKNEEIKDIVQAIGCGIENQCEISKLRYSKIILAADADPAGHFITSLLIILFAHLTPPIIKNGKLFVCKTPLYGTGHLDKFVPLWTDDELKKARDEKKEIRRAKGLGEYNPKELARFILDEKTRILIPVEWSENYQRIFDLMTSVDEKRNLVLDKWSI